MVLRTGYYDCYNNGTCIDVNSTDSSHCGSCNITCPSHKVCTGGTCICDESNGEYWLASAATASAASAACAASASASYLYSASAANIAPAPELVPACSLYSTMMLRAGYYDCYNNGTCIDVNSDNGEYCGSCNVTCTGIGQTGACSNGTCVCDEANGEH